MRHLALALVCLLPFSSPARAQTPPPPAKRLPPAGVAIPTAARTELTAGAASLASEIAELRTSLAKKPSLLALLPDVEIFHKAVDWALRYDEFFDAKQVDYARHLLTLGKERAAALHEGKAPWLDATGQVIRGYRSKLDDSVQPYALVVPADWKRGAGPARRLDVVLSGRNEKRTELAFIGEHEKSPGEIVPPEAIVLHAYGRFCNATKFAGEVDVMEALAAARSLYKIDPLRIAVAGFSMGGGSTWHLAPHFSGLWCAASPGAGFAETPIFTKALSPGKEVRPAWEQLLWRQYEATGICGNLFNVPTLAYAGEIDGQKEASDLMEAAMAKEGLKLERFIGPKTGHSYHAETKVALTKRFEELIGKGRDQTPREVWLQTYTLRYPESAWVRIEGMGQHWQLAEVRATQSGNARIEARTKNVEAVAFPGLAATTVVLDGQELHPAGADLRFHREGEAWRTGPAAGLHKSPGLTGPVDDAFMDAFTFVRPTGKPLTPELATWVEGELTSARHLWHDVYRGEAPVVADTALSDADIASKNLVLWGDPTSNKVLAKIMAKLPLTWDAKTLTFRGKTYPSANHAPILVFPNPLNPAHYVVINSGLDFRTDGYNNNALQTPKLPDWAVVDLRTPPGPRWPGKIVDAGFFDESWK